MSEGTHPACGMLTPVISAAQSAIDPAWGRADTLAVVGIAVTVAGFLLTLVQLKRTRSAALAAERASTTTQTRLASNHLLLLIPQLDRIDNDLAAAVEADHAQLVAHHLSAWRWQANVFRTLLARADLADEQTLTMVQTSIVACSNAKLKLGTGVGLEKSTIHVRKAISEVVNQLGALATLLSNNEVNDG